ncbi:hypothetical protein HNY73_010910 [Argiope bruennichi]|uniref:Uncharacterized protein n=1 Tax=Argiope bruennichi TaxID=94029 RepID=A0A8T0F2J7_ARGBR|nr:hypothetical protein HNY73_010910 [Argiope bruennichi]
MEAAMRQSPPQGEPVLFRCGSQERLIRCRTDAGPIRFRPDSDIMRCKPDADLDMDLFRCGSNERLIICWIDAGLNRCRLDSDPMRRKPDADLHMDLIRCRTDGAKLDTDLMWAVLDADWKVSSYLQLLIDAKKGKKGNITPIIFTQHATLEDDLKISSSSDEVSSIKTHADLSVVDNSIPSTFKQQKTGESNYFISPIRSDESDIEDSDEDPNFRLVHKVDPIQYHDSEQVDPQNVTVAGTNSQKPEEREERSRKRIRKPAKWKSKVAKVLRDSRKAYQSFSKSKKQVPQRKVGPPCGEKCRLKCKDKIDEMGQQLFDAFWGLGNLERQR